MLNQIIDALLPLSQFATFLGGCATAFAAIYAFLYLLPNFIRQKRIDNFTQNASKACETLVHIEELLRKLSFLTENPRSDEEHLAIQFELSLYLNLLQTHLLLLRMYPEVPNLLQWVQELRKTLDRELHIFRTKEVSHKFKEEWRRNCPENIKKVQELRETLLGIYEMTHEQNFL